MKAAAAAALSDTAPAKINLTLRVLGKRADGYHDLESLTVFARFGDLLTFRPGPELKLVVRGPTAGQAGDTTDNLVLRVARALVDQVEGLKVGTFVLTKKLPAGAGLGGGSADAAAALRLLARANGIALDDPRLRAVALPTGADVPVCLDSRPRVMRGVGEVLAAPVVLPRLAVVLVHPGIGLATKLVFAGLDLKPGQTLSPATHEGGFPSKREDFLAWLAAERNDLEPPAMALLPAVAEIRAALAATPGCRLSRMSGSGSACFGLFETPRAAREAAEEIAAAHPAWWVRASTIGERRVTRSPA